MTSTMATTFPTKPIAKLTGHNGQVHAVTYSATSAQYILTGSTDRQIRLFNPSRALISPDNTTASSSITNPASNARSKQDPPGEGLVQTYSGHGYEVLDIAVADDNARFASCGGDKLVFLWDVVTARTVRRFEGHGGRVNAVAFGGDAGDCGVVVSGSYDATVRLWDTKSQSHKALMTFTEARDSISSIVVIGHEIIAGSIDGKVRTYDIRMGQVYVDVIGYSVTSLAPTIQADSLLVSTLDSSIRLFDRQNGKLLQSYKSPSSSTSKAEYRNTEYRIRSALGMSDSIVLSGSEEGSIFAWDLVDGKVVGVVRHKYDTGSGGEGVVGAKDNKKKDVVSAVAFCSKRREWCSAGADGNVVVWGIGVGG